MQTYSTPSEFTRRFHCMNTSDEQHVKSETIAQEVAEYQARGGKIHTIPMGVSALAPGELFVSTARESIATPRLCEAAKKAKVHRKVPTPKAAKINGLMILRDAAMFMGVSANTIGRWIEKGHLEVVSQTGGNSRAKYVRKKDLETVRKTLDEQQKANDKNFVSMTKAATILGVNPTTVTKWAAKGILKIDRVELTGKRSKLIKTTDVLALKETLKNVKK